MSVNGSINKRLETSLGLLSTGPATLGRRLKEAGQTTRASVDIGFSRQLSQARFQESRDEKQAQRIMAREERRRQQELEDQEQQLSNQLKLAGINMTFQQALDTGEWAGFSEIVSNGSLPEEFQEYAEVLNKNQGQKSLDRLKLENQWAKDYAAKSLAERKFVFEQAKEWDEQDRWEAEQFLKTQQFHLKRMQDIRSNRQIANNKQNMIDFVKNTPDILTDKERDGYLLRLRNEPDREVVNQIWDEIMDRHGARLDNAERAMRARVTARGMMGPITTDASKIEVSIAERALRQALGSSFDDEFFDAQERELMILSVAQKINFHSRNMRKDQGDPEVIKRALSEVVPGFDEGNFFGLDDPSFTILPPGITEEDIEETMRANNMSRQEVLEALGIK